ncbi:MAG: N-6 DNA methylase [Myxococcota bacterium]
MEQGTRLDYITGAPVRDTPKEKVRQRIARALVHEYGLSVQDMVPGFKMKVGGHRKAIDIAIFEPGADKVLPNLRRIVICDREPKTGTKGAYRMRDHRQAEHELGLLHAAMSQPQSAGCRWGLWTNGLDLFFFEKETTPAGPVFHPRGDWPPAEGAVGRRAAADRAPLRRAERDTLIAAFRRCHNYIHGNEGMPKDVAFWQFLYLIFAKLHDEQHCPPRPPRFWAGMLDKVVDGRRQLVDEQFDPDGQQAIRERVTGLVDEVAREYADSLFGDEPPRITLSDRALAFVVGELAKYDLSHTPLDAKGAAYQELVRHNIRGDRGQYFTPRAVVDLMVRMLDPQPHERVIDPACGTGGFLVSVLEHLGASMRGAAAVPTSDEAAAGRSGAVSSLRAFAERNLFGADFDPFLVRAAQMNVLMASNGRARVLNINSLEFPAGELSGVADARDHAPLGSMDVVVTNPPFGSSIPITDPKILSRYELAHVFTRGDHGGFENTGRRHARVAPEVLFIERCLHWLRPGGRAGLVLPDGILGNPGDEWIRWWILRHFWVLASVDLPVEAFVFEANINILTSLLLLRKKTPEQLDAAREGHGTDYPVFMAVAEKIGHDRRGRPLYRRGPDGEELVEQVEHRERVRVGDRWEPRVLWRSRKVLDDDLPGIARAYRRFRDEHGEPGA